MTQNTPSISDIIVKIQRVLEDVWPKAAHYPADIHLYSLATVIQVKRNIVGRSRREGRPKISALTSSAKRFQKELAKSRALLAAECTPDLIEYYQTELDQMDAVQRSVAALLDSHKRPQRNHAKDISGPLLKAWHDTGVEVPRGTKPDDALCRAVTALLSEAGINTTASYVSDMLRERAQRPRSGPKGGGGREIAEKMPSGQAP
jgi:hypothetical protein